MAEILPLTEMTLEETSSIVKFAPIAKTSKKMRSATMFPFTMSAFEAKSSIVMLEPTWRIGSITAFPLIVKMFEPNSSIVTFEPIVNKSEM